MNGYEFEDRLELLGVLAGGFVVIVALGTLVELPWTTTENTTAALIQMVGIVATVAVGIALLAVAYKGNVKETLSRDGEDA